MPIFGTYKSNNHSGNRILPSKAPTGGSGRFDFSRGHIDELLSKADEAASLWRKSKMSSVAKYGAKAGIGVGEFLLHVTGVGMLTNFAQHGVSAAKTDQHLKELERINPGKCRCRRCDHMLGYVTEQKEKKLDRRMMQMAPGLGYLEMARSKLHWAAKSKPGEYRRQVGCTLWIAAKDGCPCAKQIVEELFSGIDGLMRVMSSYSGILAVADKLKST